MDLLTPECRDIIGNCNIINVLWLSLHHPQHEIYLLITALYCFVQPIQGVTQAEPENAKKALSPTCDQEKSPEQSSHNALPQTHHSPPTKDDGTESEVESIQYDRNPKPQKKGQSCIDIKAYQTVTHSRSQL